MNYRRKQIELEGFVLGVDPVPQWFHELNPGRLNPDKLDVNYHTPGGSTMYAEQGDLILKHGDKYWTVEKDSIDELYEVVD